MAVGQEIPAETQCLYSHNHLAGFGCPDILHICWFAWMQSRSIVGRSWPASLTSKAACTTMNKFGLTLLQHWTLKVQKDLPPSVSHQGPVYLFRLNRQKSKFSTEDQLGQVAVINRQIAQGLVSKPYQNKVGYCAPAKLIEKAVQRHHSAGIAV